MSDILFVTWDGGGNVPPALGIADALRRRGHHPRFLGHAGQVDAIRAAGHHATTYAGARPFDSSTPTSNLAMVATLGDRALGADVLAELERQPVELVVVDCLLFGVMATLHEAGRPYAVLEHTVDGYVRGAARGPLGWALRARGLRPVSLLDAGRPTLATCLPELDHGHGHVVHTGPVVTGAPARPDRSTVLLSLSTFAFRGLSSTWQRVLDAVDGLPAPVVATLGPVVEKTSLRVPDNVEVHRWVPHTDLLPHTSLVVGHGGHGTTMAALAHDIPVLVLPLDAQTDQPAVGRAVQREGAGRVLSRRARPGRIRDAVTELLAEGPHREAAARLGARIRTLDGAERAASLLEEALSPWSPPTSTPR